MVALGILKKIPPPPPGKTGWPWTEESDPGLFSPDIDWPKISIVTPSYNQGTFIEETIRSVLLQNYPNLEYVVIDGGSNDESVEIIKKYEHWISYWVSEKDRGQADALKKGLNHCNGSVFNWINSDDFLENEALFHVAKKILNYPFADVVCGNCRIFFEKTGGLKQIHRMYLSENLENTFYSHKINQPSSFFKTEIIRSLGINHSLHFAFDLEIWRRYLGANGQNKVILSDKVFSNFRIHNESKTGVQHAQFINERKQLAYQAAKSLDFPIELQEVIKRSVDSFYYESKEWDLSKLNRDRLLAYYYQDYLQELNVNKKHRTARKAIQHLLKNRNYPLTISNFRLLVKYFLFPLSWLQRYR